MTILGGGCIGQVKKYFAYESRHQHGAFDMTGGFKLCFMFIPILENDPIWWTHFSDSAWLIQPPTIAIGYTPGWIPPKQMKISVTQVRSFDRRDGGSNWGHQTKISSLVDGGNLLGSCWWYGKLSYWNNLGGGFKYLLFLPLLGEESHFDEYFSKGLKPPTSNGGADTNLNIMVGLPGIQ